MKNVNDLMALLRLKKINATTFLGHSKTIGSLHVFGGQVVAQAMNAANRTIPENRILHSLHAYFLEAGDLKIPLTFKVEKVRDGGSFSTRRVKVMQNEITIFILAASFHKIEEGYEHQSPIPINIKQPEELLSWDDLRTKFGDFLPKNTKDFLSIQRPIEFKPVRIPNPLKNIDLPANEQVWFRLKGDTSHLQLQEKQQILAYISDYNVLNAAINPNASKGNFGNLQTASLDHSMWFFRDFDFTDWMLFTAESPNSYRARGLSKGNIFTREGQLIASFAQEGLLRPKG